MVQVARLKPAQLRHGRDRGGHEVLPISNWLSVNDSATIPVWAEPSPGAPIRDAGNDR
jgi:hypothetical protein